MSETIHYKLDVQVFGGPRMLVENSLSVEAYDKLKITLAKADPPDKEVQIQPGDETRVAFLLIIPSSYDHPVTYKTAIIGTPTIYKLDTFHLYNGKGMAVSLGCGLKTLYFTNNSPSLSRQDIDIDILVGRYATPQL